jgi:hypothetical protein
MSWLLAGRVNSIATLKKFGCIMYRVGNLKSWDQWSAREKVVLHRRSRYVGCHRRTKHKRVRAFFGRMLQLSDNEMDRTTSYEAGEKFSFCSRTM